VAMNFLLGCGLVLLFAKIKDKWADPIVRSVVKLLPTSMAATITLGVAPLLFLQLTYYQQVYSATIISAWPWLSLLAAAGVAYYLFYGAAFSKDTQGKSLGLLIGIAVIALLWVSFVYSSTMSMAEDPALMQSLYASNQSGFVLNPDVGSYIFRWLHMVLGALTVGGFFVGLLGRKDETMFKVGKQFFLYGMVAASAVGLVYLMMLGEIMLPFMRSPGIWVLTVSIFLSLGSLHFFFKKKFVGAGLMVFLSMLGMVISRHVVRLLRLEGTWDPASIPVVPQWSPFIVFLLCFVLALAMIWYMLRLFFGDQKSTV